jgi:cytochrome c oxidase subunit 2
VNWILPPGVSTFAADIDRMYYLILWITGAAFVIVEATLVWFLIRYRARPGRTARYHHGNLKAEVIWTAIPAVVVVMIGVLSGGVWNEIRGRNAVPQNAVPIEVRAKQFEWNATYPGPDGAFGTVDDFTSRNRLTLPVDTPVVVRLTSEDVIHSFFVPAFRVKQDAVPGMTMNVWFEVTETGEYPLACAELCGNGHTTMGGTVEVLAQDAYERWLEAESAQRAASR